MKVASPCVVLLPQQQKLSIDLIIQIMLLFIQVFKLETHVSGNKSPVTTKIQWRCVAKCRPGLTIKVPPFQPFKFAQNNFKWKKIMFSAY